ncbi:unnamed protein product [Penicillium camemberti]|uniref:Str. FM013 n=1 Tax=Penicillium camemberti (strain FM 013) TaxID=1429867 RepID=A0A0G4NVU3_PENC3|nr:unnamed protein product [Penicillium camemberti]
MTLYPSGLLSLKTDQQIHSGWRILEPQGHIPFSIDFRKAHEWALPSKPDPAHNPLMGAHKAPIKAHPKRPL